METRKSRRGGRAPGGPERKEKQPDDQDQLDKELDEELEDTFPASDPPSVTQDPRPPR